MAYGIAIEVKVNGAKINCLPETASFRHGYRAYSTGPSCVQVQGLNEEGNETLLFDIPDRIAREFAEGILKVLDAPTNQRMPVHCLPKPETKETHLPNGGALGEQSS